jgi:hypothetical protein
VLLWNLKCGTSSFWSTPITDGLSSVVPLLSVSLMLVAGTALSACRRRRVTSTCPVSSVLRHHGLAEAGNTGVHGLVLLDENHGKRDQSTLTNKVGGVLKHRLEGTTMFAELQCSAWDSSCSASTRVFLAWSSCFLNHTTLTSDTVPPWRSVSPAPVLARRAGACGLPCCCRCHSKPGQWS